MVVIIVCTAIHRQHTIVAHMIKIKVDTLPAYRSANIADMIHYIVAIAALNDIDLTETILRKDKAAAVKYHHTMDLETFLNNRRTQ